MNITLLKNIKTSILEKPFENFDLPKTYTQQELGLTRNQYNSIFFPRNWPTKFFYRYLTANRLKELTAKANIVAERIDHFIATEGKE